jgi:hypothetical protein
VTQETGNRTLHEVKTETLYSNLWFGPASKCATVHFSQPVKSHWGALQEFWGQRLHVAVGTVDVDLHFAIAAIVDVLCVNFKRRRRSRRSMHPRLPETQTATVNSRGVSLIRCWSMLVAVVDFRF